MPDQDKKKIKRAAALSYDPSRDGIPTLSAYGEGFVAEKILKKAEEASVPVMFDENLAAMLSNIAVGDQIPPELYEAVAQILVFLSETDRAYGEKMRAAVSRR